MRDVASVIISHEQTQSNRLCCFQNLDNVFQRISFQNIVTKHLYSSIKLMTSVNNNLYNLQFLGKVLSFLNLFFKCSTCKMVASLECSKIQMLMCDNSITSRIVTDTYNTVYMTI